ncbi:Bcr/CflA family drug resistance efflux transporter [Shewanella gelidii]|uniref:Bcr/CflA family efflux transporter n=2 Tax=Shewanella gelidii TaxID=1642821 RepID=A0A917NA23_9GAMM|nr:Bcr/CflA family drug resistance efflux transporter [Shewanella gelidii]
MVVLSPLAIDIYLPSMPVMAQEFAVSAAEIQSTLVLFLFSMGVGQILIGPLADKFGRRPVALAGIGLYILSSALAVFALEFSWLQLARVLQGLAACATSIVVFSAVRDSFTAKDSAKIYSYLNGAICVIPALAPTLGGLLALQFGWRSTFLFMMGYGLIALLFVSRFFRETKPSTTIVQKGLYRWSQYRPVVSNGHFMFYATACMTGMAAIVCYVSYSPMWLIDHLGVSELAFSGLFGLNAFVNALACFVAPLIIRRLGNRRSVIVSLTAMVFSGVCQVLAQWFGPQSGMAAAFSFMLPMMLLCIGFALLLGPATTMALAGFGERAGTATAMLGFIQMSGASFLAGLVQLSDLTAPFAVTLVMVSLATLLLVMMCFRGLNHWHQEQFAH